jgi:signal transduction histidine kinase
VFVQLLFSAHFVQALPNNTTNNFEHKISLLHQELELAKQKKDSSLICQAAINLALFLQENGLENNASVLLKEIQNFCPINTSSHNLSEYDLLLKLVPKSEYIKTSLQYILQADEEKNVEHIKKAYNNIINNYLNINDLKKTKIYIDAYKNWLKENHLLNHFELEQTINDIRFYTSTDQLQLADSLYSNLIIYLDSLQLTSNDIPILIKLIDYPNLTEEFLLKIKSFDNTENHFLEIAQIDEKLALMDIDSSTVNMFHAVENTIQAQFEFQEKIKIANRVLQEKIATEEPEKKSRISIWRIIVTAIIFVICFFILLRIRKGFKTFKATKIDTLQQRASLQKQIELADKEIEKRIAEREVMLKNELEEREKIDLELQIALKKGEEANFMKNNFMSNMSHEIRTPLNGILGFSSLLETELALMDKQDLFEYANTIQQSGDKLLHLLNNIIDISRIQANDIELFIKQTDLESIVDEIIAQYDLKAKEKGLRIIKSFEKIDKVFVDPKLMNRIICELVDNSVKYTDKGYIKISCSLNSEKGVAELLVTDTGNGIEEKYLTEIFEPYRQESLGYSRHYQGAGLGLPLVKSMIDLMNCTLAIESVKAKGTSIRISIPLAKEQTEETGNEFAPPLHVDTSIEDDMLNNLSILIVEDDELNMKVFSSFLKKSKSLFQASNGDQAIEMIRKKADENKYFDIILLDINLPGNWDGIKILRFIREEFPMYKYIPIVAQTAYSMSGDREYFLSLGFDEYLPKPISKQGLLTVIEYTKNKLKT